MITTGLHLRLDAINAKNSVDFHRELNVNVVRQKVYFTDSPTVAYLEFYIIALFSEISIKLQKKLITEDNS